MIKTVGMLAILIVLATLCLGSYLSLDDLGVCDKTPTGVGNCTKADVIIAISGGDTNSRTKEAIRLYKNGWASKLIFSGAASDKNSPSNASVMKDIAINAGVLSSAIYIDEDAETTKQNAQNVQAMYKDLNVKSAILVTSGYHQRRASLEFNKLDSGVKLINHPANSDKDWSFWWWLTPNGWYLAMTEIFKIGMFFVIGTR